MESMNFSVELGKASYSIGIDVEEIEDKHYAVMHRYILTMYAAIRGVATMFPDTNIDDMIDGIFHERNDSE